MGRTAQALRARSQKTRAGLVRIKSVVDQLARCGGPITVAAVARQADVSRTFLYEHTEARNTNAEVVNQRERIAELLGQIAALQGEWTDADVVRITIANVTLQREVRALTVERGRLTERLSAAQDNARVRRQTHRRTRSAVTEQLTAPPS
ncbi:DUF6262 family protein [Streptomyces murinus]|uniref:DUF6262 family protein n=1 Tax=Streptomyces murinus TaxID=33900 RepID=UPI000A237F87|nr:DUF6262 family protein [Streptomyces murinus]WDO04860.1 DUF6262 family protein [Streptomyces murinus]